MKQKSNQVSVHNWPRRERPCCAGKFLWRSLSSFSSSAETVCLTLESLYHREFRCWAQERLFARGICFSNRLDSQPGRVSKDAANTLTAQTFLSFRLNCY